MNKSVVVVGLGEMGSVFARGFLRCGYSVHPVTRDMEMQTVANEVKLPELVLIAVGEAGLQQQLTLLPDSWRDRLVLLQNELLPQDWLQHELNPTVISVWFEKKKGQDSKVIMPSPVYGQHALVVSDALASIDIPANLLSSESELLHALVVKNVYILTTNIAGLEVGGNVGQLWRQHRELAMAVASEVIHLQETLTGAAFDRDKLIAGMVAAFEGDSEHMCMGRSAPGRLQRALSQAIEQGLSLKSLHRISLL